MSFRKHLNGRPFVCLAGIVLALNLYGQQEELFFKHLTTDDGLSHNTVYAINQDSLGFIWVGTRSGLNRFDGEEFTIYDNNQGLRNGFVNTIFRDADGVLWIGTQEGGLSRYNYLTDDFTCWANKPNDSSTISQDNVLSITEDQLGHLWVGTHDGGLNCFDRETQTFQRIKFRNSTSKEISITRINALCFENDSVLWIGTYTGLHRYNTRNQILTPISFPGQPSDVWVTGFFRENEKILWIGSKSGLIRLDKSSGSAEFFTASNSKLSNDLITDIKPYTDGRLMIATDGGGLNILDMYTRGIISYTSDPNSQSSLSNNSVYNIFIDRNKAVWIGNYIGGINYFNQNEWKFKTIRHELNNPVSLSDNHVRTFLEDREGNIWIGTLGGFNLYNSITGKFTTYTFDKEVKNSVSSNSVLTFYEDRKGNLWIGTFGGGISIFDKRKKTFSKYHNKEDLSNSLDKANIYKILETNDGRLCIASLGGIYLVDLETGGMKRYMSSNSKLTNNTVKTLCRDREGNIWIGTNRGLNKLDPESEEIKVYLHSLDDPKSLSNNRVLCIYESADRMLWIGTEGGGVSIFDPASGIFKSVSMNDGLPDNVINSIVQDDADFLWFSTNKGLVRYDAASGKIMTYNQADGLQGNEFYQNSVMKTSDGRLFFGGPYGFNEFYPHRLELNTLQPEIVLTDLYISNKRVRVTDKGSPIDRQLFLLKTLTLPYQTSFEIHFSFPGYLNKGKFLSSYKLEGGNEGWTEYRNIRAANFANLRPGRYTLKVRSATNEGANSESLASINIVILPPLWKTWWAFCIYALILGLLLFFFMRINNLKVKAKHQLLAEIKEKEQQDELNQLKLRFFTDISHEFKTPLTLILGHVDNLRNVNGDKRSETMQGIEKNARRLLMLINQLLEFRKAESGLMKLKAAKGNIVLLLKSIKDSFNELAEKKGIAFQLIVEESIPEIWFDSEKIEKVIFNLLSNAFKATNTGGEIRMGISVIEQAPRFSEKAGNSSVLIRVTDTGIGINPDDIQLIFERFYDTRKSNPAGHKAENSGIGLAFSKRLVELHHGEISVESEKDVGSVFTIKLPTGKDHLTDDEIREDASVQLILDYPSLTNALLNSSDTDSEGLPSDNKLPIMLVVDDNPEVCTMLSQKFRDFYLVLTASNGEMGFKKASRFLPDIVIADVMMPVCDGFEFCHRMKTSMMTCHIPVILLTAKSGDENQIDGFKSGADAYISKPYNPELLEVTVENLTQNRLVLRKKFSHQADFIPSEVLDNKLDEEFLNKLIARIENEEFSENMDVTSLCRELAMSRSVLYRKIKMLTGNSIQEFVRVVKLRKAARLLGERSKSVSEIAYSSGFSNTKHFSTAFKKFFGKTPSEYRKGS